MYVTVCIVHTSFLACLCDSDHTISLSHAKFWWGGWLMYKYPDKFDFNSFLISMFTLLFSLFALGAAAQGATDKKKAEAAAGRLFYLINRESANDPLDIEGKKLD